MHHGFLSQLLQLAADGGVDVVAIGIGRHPVAIEHFLAGHLRRVVCSEAQLRPVVLCAGRLGKSLCPAVPVNVAQRQHAPQNPVAALLAGLGPADGIIARWRFRNAGEHGVLRQCQVLDAAAVVHLCSGFKAVGAMAQKHAVEIQLKNFFLVQRALNLDRQQNFVEFARERALQAEKIVTRHLHGQCAAAGAFFTRQRKFRHGAHQAGEVHAAVGEETIVLSGQQGLHKLRRNVLETQRIALLLAELADQVAVACIHLHGRL